MTNKFIVAIICLINLAGMSASSQTANAWDTSGLLTMEKVLYIGREFDLIKPMVGNWNVQQKVWQRANAKPVVANHIARRTLSNHFLEEVMEPTPGSKEPFKRIAYFQFNNANHVYEYIVLDSRYPVMMFERSMDAIIQNGKELTMYLPGFVMPPGWDPKLAGQLASQRRTISFESPDLTVMRQYWTLPGVKEFLAIEYTYTRQK